MISSSDKSTEKQNQTLLNCIEMKLSKNIHPIPIDPILELNREKKSPDNYSISNLSDNRYFNSPDKNSVPGTPIPRVRFFNKFLDTKNDQTPKSDNFDFPFCEVASTKSNFCPNLFNLFVEKSIHNSEVNFTSPKRTININDRISQNHEECSNSIQSQENSINQDSDEESASKIKSNKGLKFLSISVRDIVIERQSVTYKEVADVILQEMINLDKFKGCRQTDLSKEEQNIKRRVYDALNVLISAKILIKDGKRVRKNDNSSQIKVNCKRSEINSLGAAIV